MISDANGPSGDIKNLIPGSVGSADLHTGAVTADRLAPNSVDSSKVVADSLKGADIKESKRRRRSVLATSPLGSGGCASAPGRPDFGASPRR